MKDVLHAQTMIKIVLKHTSSNTLSPIKAVLLKSPIPQIFFFFPLFSLARFETHRICWECLSPSKEIGS